MLKPKHVVAYVEKVPRVDPDRILGVVHTFLSGKSIPHSVTIDPGSIDSISLLDTVRSMSERLLERFERQPESLHLHVAATIIRARSRPQIEMPFVFAATKIRGDNFELAVQPPPREEMPGGFFAEVTRQVGHTLGDLLDKSAVDEDACEFARVLRHGISVEAMYEMLVSRERPSDVSLQ